MLTLDECVVQLKVPQDYARYELISEEDIIRRLNQWKAQVRSVLADLKTHLEQRDALSLDEQAQVVVAVTSFDGEDAWVSGQARQQAQDILRPYDPPELSLLEVILARHLKPIFRSNPHPSVNPSTGRTLPRPAGGSMGHLDHLEGQTWKTHPGIANVVSWCVRHSEGAVYEKLWHLLIPPIMTLLDDYEAPYKLRGIRIVSEMLQRVPADLLRRTGVDALLLTSLKTCLTFLHNPETPSLIRAAVPTAVSLVRLTQPTGSAARFDQLCALLGDGIIGNIWLYATRDSDAIVASVDVLPEVVHALDIGAVRYLKAIIPQLVYPLLPVPETRPDTALQLSSLCALCVVIRACAPRMHKWKGEVLEGVLKCWVALCDNDAPDPRAYELKRALKEACDCLSEACPSLRQIEYPRLLRTDEKTFGPLVGAASSD